MWVLVLIYIGHAMTSIDGYAQKDACEAAGKAAVADLANLSRDRASFICVRKGLAPSSTPNIIGPSSPSVGKCVALDLNVPFHEYEIEGSCPHG